jgi:hypothetical protein
VATVQDLVTSALKEIGVLATSETGTSAEHADAFVRLNRYIDRLATEKLTIYSVTRTTATLTANQASFTVGAGGNINIARPEYIEKVNFIDTSLDPDTEFQLPPLLTELQYQSITLKALTSVYPQAAYYNPTYPTGTLIPWPIPTSATLLWAVYHWTAVTQFASLATTVSLPPAYEEALIMNLALLLCPAYERQPHPMLVEVARTSMAALKRANQRMRDLQFGPDVMAGRYGDQSRGYWIMRS